MNKTYKIGEFAKLTGYSVNSLKRLNIILKLFLKNEIKTKIIRIVKATIKW